MAFILQYIPGGAVNKCSFRKIFLPRMINEPSWAQKVKGDTYVHIVDTYKSCVLSFKEVWTMLQSTLIRLLHSLNHLFFEMI